ncbi:MAG TPA: ERCC4 domain-containing protein [Candidatus Lokiarchaeia archaeon]|nr:ERCC4 domain-containing protein [Candidatus Lokiarchaeia archaeon]
MSEEAETGQKTPRIVMDDREPEEIKQWLEKEGVIVEKRRLEVGDFVVSSDVVVERKSSTDLTTSIIDNRLFEQVIRLYDCASSPILILENFNSIFEISTMNPASIFGALVYLAWRFSLPMLPSRDWRDTALILKRLAIRVQVKDEDPILARSIPKMMTLEERKAFILEGLVGVGPKTAIKLIDQFQTPLNVFKAIQDSSVLYTKTGNPKGIEGPLEGIKGIGPKFLIENKKLVEGE